MGIEFLTFADRLEYGYNRKELSILCGLGFGIVEIGIKLRELGFINFGSWGFSLLFLKEKRNEQLILQ